MPTKGHIHFYKILIIDLIIRSTCSKQKADQPNAQEVIGMFLLRIFCTCIYIHQFYYYDVVALYSNTQ